MHSSAWFTSPIQATSYNQLQQSTHRDSSPGSDAYQRIVGVSFEVLRNYLYVMFLLCLCAPRTQTVTWLVAWNKTSRALPADIQRLSHPSNTQKRPQSQQTFANQGTHYLSKTWENSRQPGDHRSNPLDPWLCVRTFQCVCHIINFTILIHNSTLIITFRHWTIKENVSNELPSTKNAPSPQDEGYLTERMGSI
jgi:hypothetical protein